MSSPIYRNLGVLLLVSVFVTNFSHAQEKKPPLTSRILLALVAGNALSENVAHEIASRGLAFRATDQLRAQLTATGADARVLAALAKAPSVNLPDAENKESSELLQHLSVAGKLMRSNQYKEAAEELNAALQSGGGPETGFVMGELLRRREQWVMAVSVYKEVLEKDPGYPEVHTKLSYLLYRLGDSEGSLREAKAALALTPNNAEAHKNAGLAYQIMRKFDACSSETCPSDPDNSSAGKISGRR